MAYPFSTHEVNRNAEMNLRDSLDRLGRIVPHASDFRGIGSHCKSAPPLEKEFAKFVNDPTSKGKNFLCDFITYSSVCEYCEYKFPF